MKPSFTQTEYPVQMSQTQGRRGDPLSLGVASCIEKGVALKGCQDQVGHLGLECMLDLMHDQFFWPHMAAQAKEHIRKCHLCLAFKSKQPKAALKISWSHIPWSLSTSITCVWNQDQNCPNYCQKPMGEIYCPPWVTQKDPFGSRPKL